MNFCSQCGTEVERRVPDGDDRERAVCPGCGWIFYENPKLVVGCLVEHADGLLLCRRAIEPSRGLWTPPAGYLELGESARDGAVRETWEEARARVEVLAPFGEFDLLHIGQVYRLYRAVLTEPGFAAGAESLEVEVFPLDALPFGELAFPVIEFALRLYRDDRRTGRHASHAGALRWNGEGSRWDVANYRLEGHRAVPFAKP